MIICKISNRVRLQFLKFLAVYLYVTKAQPIANGVLSSLNRKIDRYTTVGTTNENLTEALLNTSDNILKSNTIIDKNFKILKEGNHRLDMTYIFRSSRESLHLYERFSKIVIDDYLDFEPLQDYNTNH